MSTAVILAVMAAAAGVAAFGAARIVLPRKPGPEAIEDAEAARAYERISDWPQFRLLRRLIARRLAGHHPAGVLADIGCGPGRLAFVVAGRHPNVRIIGVDASREMVERARTTGASLGLAEQVEFRVGDVCRLPLAEGSVDFALSTLSLHHWADPARGLREIHRVLTPGGQLLLFDLRRDARRFMYWLLRFARGFIVPSPIRRINEPVGSLLASYSAAELRDLFSRLPFAEYQIHGSAGWAFTWARKT